MNALPVSTFSEFFSGIQAKMPVFTTRKALVILNMQNDSFERRHSMVLCEQQDFRQPLGKVIPHFRRIGDIIWIKTELDMSPLSPSSSCSKENNTGKSQSQSPRSSSASDEASPRQIDNETITHYFPSSRKRAILRKSAPEARSEARRVESEAWGMDEDPEAYLKKPRKGAPADSIFVPGTRGVELTPDMLALVDLRNDLVITKNHYSAFDATPLLISLRMKLITHIYLAGCLSNISVYSTAADAVQHGFEVTVVEDCLGYRSEEKHVEAMKKMADLLGVSGIDSSELIEEAGEPPRARGDSEMSASGNPELVSRQVQESLRGSTSPGGQNSASLAPMSRESPGSRSPLTSMSPPETTPMEGIETNHHHRSKSGKTFLGPGDKVGEGDSSILVNALSPSLAEDAFKKVLKEVDWQVMRHRNGEVPRRVAVQGETGLHGAVPLYRHPADESPPFFEFTPTVRKIRDELQILLKQPFNHCLIQLYRNGQDNISEHSDKTLDIVRGSSIINLSLGAQRTMTLRSKKDANLAKDNEDPAPRNIQRVPMPHNSCFVLGWRSNQKWLHGIRPDKRLLSEKTEEERAYNGQRISLTFRNIGTYTNRARTRIWGQGAKSKFEATAGQIITVNNPEMEAMIYAFGMENHLMDFDWDAHYGGGFDVLNLVIAGAPTITTLHLCADEISNLRVKMAIIHRSVPCRIIQPPVRSPVQSIDHDMDSSTRPSHQKRSIFALSGDENPVFRDCDANQSEAVGDIATLVYISRFYPPETDPNVTAREEHRVAQSTFARLTSSNELLFLWQELRGIPFNGSTRASHRIRRFISNDTIGTDPSTGEGMDLGAIFEAEMQVWEEIASEATYISGEIFHVTDCAIWPVLNEIIRRWEGWSERRYPYLATYWKKIGAMPATRKAMMERGEDAGKEGFSSRGSASSGA